MDKELILIDTGPWREGYVEEISLCLAEMGFSIKDLSKIIYTHPHPDHMGGGIEFQREVDALHMIHEEARDHVEQYGKYVQFMKSQCKETFLSHLIHHPEKGECYSEVVENFWRPTFGEVKIDHALREGEIIRSGKLRLEVVFNPGHSPWDISLWEEKTGLFFTGDAFMQKMTTLISGLRGFGSDLNAYGVSLHKAERYLKRAKWILPSHGVPIREGDKLAKDLLKVIQWREERILERISIKDSSLFDLQEIFNPSNDPVVFVRRLGVILSHIEKLEEEDKILRLEQANGDILFRLKK